jgi:hypothetical protein
MQNTPRAFLTASTSTNWRPNCTTGKTNEGTDRWIPGRLGIGVSRASICCITISAITTASAQDRDLHREPAYREMVRTPFLDCGLRGAATGRIQSVRRRTIRDQAGCQQLGQVRTGLFAAIKNHDVEALGASFNLCSSAWRKMLPAIFEHPTITVPVMQRLRSYQRKYAGAPCPRAAVSGTSTWRPRNPWKVDFKSRSTWVSFASFTATQRGDSFNREAGSAGATVARRWEVATATQRGRRDVRLPSTQTERGMSKQRRSASTRRGRSRLSRTLPAGSRLNGLVAVTHRVGKGC